MLLETIEYTTNLASAAQASMREHSIAPTPQNFAIWYEYQIGRNVELMRTLDVYVSNQQPFSDHLLDSLYRRFFTLMEDHGSILEASEDIQQRLDGLLGLIDGVLGKPAGHDVSAPARVVAEVRDLTTLINELVSHTLSVAGRSRQLDQHLESSTSEIASLHRLLDETRHDAASDALTGIYNRKAFDLKLRQLAGEAMNTGDDLCLLLVDIDHFKSVNDTLGHQAGDDVLRSVAEMMRRTLRKQDFLARYGGEEFAIILEATPLAIGGTIAEKIRSAVQQMVPATREGQHAMGPVTVSLGVSCFDPGESMSDWIERTDVALYQAKREGRNRVICTSISD